MTLDDHKALFIKELVADMQRLDPLLSFREAWDEVQRDKPDLFERDNEGEASVPGAKPS